MKDRIDAVIKRLAKLQDDITNTSPSGVLQSLDIFTSVDLPDIVTELEDIRDQIESEEKANG